MIRREAPGKINLALVVGPLRADGKHEVATVLQRIDLADVIELSIGEELSVSGFADDTLVAEGLVAFAAAAGVEPRWSVHITKAIPVSAGLGGGSSDAATALALANESLDSPLDTNRLVEIAAGLGADVPFFLREGPQLGTDDGSRLTAIDLPQDFLVVLALPDDERKDSTSEVYGAFDARSGANGFEERRSALMGALSAIRLVDDLATLPLNDLATSPLADRLLRAGALRADVSGAGPCVYGVFSDPDCAHEAARELRATGRTWVVKPR